MTYRKFLMGIVALLMASVFTSTVVAEEQSKGTLYFCMEEGQGASSLSAILAYASEHDLGIGDGCTLTIEQKRALDLIYFGAVEDNSDMLWRVISGEGIPTPTQSGKWSFAGVQWVNPNTSRIQVVCSQGMGQETVNQLKQDAINGDYLLLESCQEPADKLHYYSQFCFWDASTDYLWTPFGDGLPVGLSHGILPYVAWRDPYTNFAPVVVSR